MLQDDEEDESLSMNSELDLPLMANVDEIDVYHYILDLQCFVEKKEFHGSITLFCKPTNDTSNVKEQNKSTREDIDVHVDELESLDCIGGVGGFDSTKFPNIGHTTSINIPVKDVKTDPFSSDRAKSVESCYNKPCTGTSSTCRKYKEENMSCTLEQKLTEKQLPFTETGNLDICSHHNVIKSELGKDGRHDTCTDTSIPHEPLNQNCSHNTCADTSVQHESQKQGLFQDGSQNIHTCTSLPHDRLNQDSSHYTHICAATSVSQEPLNQDCMCTTAPYDPHQNQILSTRFDRLNSSTEDFCLILDSNCINVLSVKELCLPSDLCENVEKCCVDTDRLKTASREGTPLLYSVETNYIKIWKTGVKTSQHFPNVVQIVYQTQENGQSLKWTTDQDGSECVYTHGHWINNRSLFPSQDAPIAMATWHAVIRVPRGLVVLMSGDKDPTVVHETDWTSFHFSTTMKMPSSTLSLAVGHWSEVTSEGHNTTAASVSPISYRIFAPLTYSSSGQELHRYVPVCLSVVTQILGKHPFDRQDILIVPSSFDSMGMASPCVSYLCQSVLAGDLSMGSRIAHEFCHTWFGIIIGPKDWTEEWLTEGFCTYLEDIVHADTMVRLNIWTEAEVEQYRDIQHQLRYRTLVAEISNTQDDLQTLRPNQDMKDEGDSKKFVKNGMNPEKKFMQVHYLKGYFLLCFLEQTEGKASFLKCLKQFTTRFHGCYISSEDVIDFILTSCQNLCNAGITQKIIFEDWLNFPGMPKTLVEPIVKQDNKIARTTLDQVQIFKEKCKVWRKKRARKRRIDLLHDMSTLNPVQLLWCLELLLDEEKIPHMLLYALRNKYEIEKRNADIQHRWCELIIKHKAEHYYSDVHNFLIQHQGMGVYLFGELVLSGSKKQRQVAERTFQLIKAEMEPDPYKNVHAMLFGV